MYYSVYKKVSNENKNGNPFLLRLVFGNSLAIVLKSRYLMNLY